MWTKPVSSVLPVRPRRCRSSAIPRATWSASPAVGRSPNRPGSVLVLDDEVGTADGSGQLRLLPCELEPCGELLGNFHPVGELEPDRPLPAVVDGIQHVDRQTTLVEDVGPSDVLDLEARRFERARRD